MLPAARLHTFKVAAAAALLAGGYSSMFASADCEDIKALPTGTMTKDVHLFLDDLDSLSCDEVTTINVDGPYNYVITGDEESETFRKVRFDISGGANFYFDLANEEFEGTAKFTGVTGWSSDGGVFNVEKGSSATFEVPVAFESNSVDAPYSGGAVYVAGEATFQYDAAFTRNTVKSGGDNRAHNGGGLCVASGGKVRFEDSTSFVENKAESGGQGGAVANFGELIFKGTSFYQSNLANEDGDETGGTGGAIYTEEGSDTLFEGRAIMQYNLGASGGALYNKGTTDLRNGAFFRSNRAQGGAVYVDTGASYSESRQTKYIDNSASDDCPNVYARGKEPLCPETKSTVALE